MTDEHEFEQKLWKLNEFGDFQNTFNLVAYLEGCDYKDRNGDTVNMDLFIKTYSKYLAWWDYHHGEKDPKFLKSSDSLKSIHEFLKEKMYLKEWQTPPKNRDNYLFGNLSKDHLLLSLEGFISSINESKKSSKAGT